MPRPPREIPWLDKPKGSSAFYVFWYDTSAKRTQRTSLRTSDPAEAQARFAAFLSEGGDVIRRSASLRLSVTSAIEQYLKEHVDVNCADPRRQRDAAKHLVAFFGETPMADVDIPLSRSYRKYRGAAPATVRRELVVLSAAANHAAKWKRMPKADLPTVEYPAAPKTRTQFFTPGEVQALIASSTGKLRAFIVLAYFTAARRKSIEYLEMDQIDTARRVIHLHKAGQRVTKKRKASVPINDACMREIEWLAAETKTKLLFGRRIDFYRPFRSLCEAIGLDDRYNPHLLRHSRATHLLEAGQDIYRVAGLLGDTVKTIETTYGHHTPEHAAAAVAPSDAGIMSMLAAE